MTRLAHTTTVCIRTTNKERAEPTETANGPTHKRNSSNFPRILVVFVCLFFIFSRACAAEAVGRFRAERAEKVHATPVNWYASHNGCVDPARELQKAKYSKHTKTIFMA